MEQIDLRFDGEVIAWHGPAPHQFVPVPPDACAELRAVSRVVSYGWGVIPVTARIGGTTWTTSLFPKDGGYLLPVKVAVRRAERLDVGSRVSVRVSVRA
ncbi:MAG TPA: DUF1905 domain-containing protein [Cellulomonas sp.]